MGMGSAPNRDSLHKHMGVMVPYHTSDVLDSSRPALHDTADGATAGI